MVLYFVSEITMHLVGTQAIEATEYGRYTKQAIDSCMHEAMELVAVTGIFYVYRARRRGEFFSLILQHDNVTVPRIIPFYIADKTTQRPRTASNYAVILKPTSCESTYMSSVLLGVPSNDGTSSPPRDSSSSTQPLLARSVELQSY